MAKTKVTKKVSKPKTSKVNSSPPMQAKPAAATIQVKKEISREIPVGIKIIAIVNYIGGAFLILVSLFLMLGSSFIAALFASVQEIPIIGKIGAIFFLIIGIIFLLLSIVNFAIGYGLWKLREWARVLTVIFAAIGVITAVLLIVLDPFSSIFQIIINGLIIWYLAFNKEVKAVFH